MRAPFARLAAVGLAVSMAASCSNGGSKGPQPAVDVAVPFVGCARASQTESLPAPSGDPKVVHIDPTLAPSLAYYSDGGSVGVLGPRGWYCFGIYGANGSSLFISPQPIQFTDFTLAANLSWNGGSGQAIQLSWSLGDSPGKVAVAQVVARVFPARAAFVQSVMSETDLAANQFPSGAFPTDTMTPKGDDTVEYQTPPDTAGLGTTTTTFSPSDDPISGVAILQGQTPNLLMLAVRLPGGQAALAPIIVRHVEQDEAATR